MRSHFTHTRVAIMEKSDNNKYCLECGESEHLYTAGDYVNGAATLENRQTVL